MNNADLIRRLRVQLQQLEQEVLQHDSHLPASQSKLMQDTERFNDQLFYQSGAQLGPCIMQISKNIAHLEKMLKGKISNNTILLACEQIQDRFTAVKRAMNTTDIDVKAAQQTKATRIARAKKATAVTL